MTDTIPDRDDIARAHERIAPHVRRTSLLTLEAGAAAPVAVTLKLELTQHTGSFKPRGAFNTLLSKEVPEAGVVAASGGNHGAAVAYAARALGHRARIFVPEISSRVKIGRIRDYGADVVVGGASYAEAYEASLAWQGESGAMALHAYDAPETVAGQGTLARELEGQMDGFDTVVVAVGGGGLMAGLAAWLGGRVRIVAVEPERAPTLERALAAGAPVDVAVGGVAADSLGARRIGGIGFALARRHVDRALLVSDEAIGEAQRLLWRTARIVAEPGGATALAALASGAYVPRRGERVVVVACGGNADLAALA